MKPGERIVILPSLALSEMKLELLVGTTAIVVEVHKTRGKISGCWVELPKEYLGSREWYIPYNSIGT